MRYAIYLTPPPGSALAQFGRRWLGAPPSLDGLPDERWRRITASPRRYGFHATLKPPFALADALDEAALRQRMAAFAAGQAAFSTQPLVLGVLGRFLALLPSAEEPRLSTLAGACVTEFDSLRAPPSDGELARRRASGLTARQDALLRRWGYPFVLDEFRFHFTLTEPLEAEERRLVGALLAALLPEPAPLAVDGVNLFVEDAPQSPFRELARYSFRR